jgi:hypothetical protein
MSVTSAFSSAQNVDLGDQSSAITGHVPGMYALTLHERESFTFAAR